MAFVTHEQNLVMSDLYREHIIEHARYPRNKGVLVGAARTHREANASCGDVCVMQVGERGLMFDGQGCALSIAAASLLTEWWDGCAPTDEDFLQKLGVAVTSGRLDCALLPLRALRGALKE